MHVASAPDVPAVPKNASVLVVNDDPAARETVRLVLRRLNIQVHEADTGASAIAAMRARRFDLVLIDLRLPDISGLDVIAELKKSRVSVPWLLMSGWMTTSIAVEAIKLGAVDAVDLPFDIETVVVSALREVSRYDDLAEWPQLPPTSTLTSPKSSAERWAFLVLRGCRAEHDPKTIHEWASAVGVSYSVLKEICHLVGMRSHDARDFLRVLRALLWSMGHLEHLEHGLNVNDRRTLQALFQRAGFTAGPPTGAISLHEFVKRQRFVDPDSEAVKVLLKTIVRD
jgi:ActR/RegA family two-component response regulator